MGNRYSQPFLAPGQSKYLVIAIIHFTKWIEAEPLPIITIEKVRKFVWKMIICTCGIPCQLVSDKGIQFTEWRFEDLCKVLGIVQLFSSVECSQTNKLAEAGNKIILAGLKKRLE